MKYYVKFDCLGMKAEGGSADLPELVGKQIEYIEKSGKLKDGGSLLGVRGGYFILDVDKPVEIMGLLGPVFWEHFQIEVHPVISFKEMNEYMLKEFKKAA